MKKLALLILLMMIFQSSVFSRPVVFNDDGKFGLKDENGNIVVKAEYKKLIRLGEFEIRHYERRRKNSRRT